MVLIEQRTDYTSSGGRKKGNLAAGKLYISLGKPRRAIKDGPKGCGNMLVAGGGEENQENTSDYPGGT